MASKILVVEDSPTVLEMMRAMLVEKGYTVITAADGQEALDKARSQKPDLIVLDLMLPKVDGYKVCAMLKFDKNFSKTPIIILTARAGESDRAMAGDARADAYLVKPVEEEALLSKARELLKEK